MADLSLDRNTTALLIADFYAEMMGSLPHAVANAQAKTVEFLWETRE